MCAIDDAEIYDFYQQRMQRAKKAHICCECRRTIQPGELYEYVFGRLDGVSTVKTCAHCVAAASWLDDECNGHLFGGVAEELSDHWDLGSEYVSVWLARVLIGIKRKWTRRDGMLMEIPAPYVRKARAA